MTKKELRGTLLQRLARQPEKTRLVKSRKITERLRRLSVYRDSKVLMCYVAVGGEVETRLILAQALADGKRVTVPVVLSKHKRLAAAEISDLEIHLNAKGALGIPEPHPSARRILPAGKLDLIIVPGLAFDRRGHRLGRGAGYFDRFLSRLAAHVPMVGVAFDFQVKKRLPVEPHDWPVSKIITEKEVIR